MSALVVAKYLAPATYLHAGLVVLVHRHGRELCTDSNHRVVKEGGDSLILVEPLDCLLNELVIQTAFVLHAPEQVGNERVMRWIRFTSVRLLEHTRKELPIPRLSCDATDP